MTIDEAIELLQGAVQHHLHPNLIDERQAVRLGIEALKRLNTLRQDPRLSAAAPLLSETED